MGTKDKSIRENAAEKTPKRPEREPSEAESDGVNITKTDREFMRNFLKGNE